MGLTDKPLSPPAARRWQRLRRRGRVVFVIVFVGLLGGGSLALLLGITLGAFGPAPFEADSFWKRFLLYFSPALFFCTHSGFILGAVTWRIAERRYQRHLAAQPAVPQGESAV